MAAEVIVRPPAAADVREAAFWYEAKREGLGAEFVLELDALYDRIAQHPLQFPDTGEGTRRALLRRFPYAVYFVVDYTPVVLAVLHQHRKPRTWQERP
jgi:plasmid stabilization system protein ParE